MENTIISELTKLIEKAVKKDESPIGAIIMYNNKIIAKAYNNRNKTNNTLGHAEIIAIKKANKRLKSWRLNKCTLYVSLEPCDMCKSIIKESRIEKVIYYLPRNPEKKQYEKTVFLNTQNNSNETINFINNYQVILKKFWQNKR